jgi:aspartyl-tRNA(Asn)/glutamyl-tRNA(Gln) amidotransferase subunit A
MLLSHNMNIS